MKLSLSSQIDVLEQNYADATTDNDYYLLKEQVEFLKSTRPILEADYNRLEQLYQSVSEKLLADETILPIKKSALNQLTTFPQKSVQLYNNYDLMYKIMVLNKAYNVLEAAVMSQLLVEDV